MISKFGKYPDQPHGEKILSDHNRANFLFNPFQPNNEMLLAWNQYMFQWQETSQQFFQSWLRAWGLPTRDEMSQTGQQIFDLANRLDAIEDELNILIESKAAENSQLTHLEELLLEIKASLAQPSKEQDHSHPSRLRVVS